MARSEFSRLRGIAQKRLERLQMAGLASPAIRLPKASELTAAQKAGYVKQFKSFLESGSTVREAKKTPEKTFVPTSRGIAAPKTEAQIKRAEQRARKTQVQRERRHILAGLTKTQQGWIQGARNIGVKIGTKNLSAFVEYMEYRYAQNKDSSFYTVVDDFADIQEKKKKAVGDITADFARFKADRQEIIDMRDDGRPGYDKYAFDSLWRQYIKNEID